MHNKFTSALRTWTNVLTRPGEQVFAAERKNTTATLSTALWWILLINAMTILLNLLNTTLLDEWILHRNVQDLSALPEVIAEILSIFQDISIASTHLYLAIASLYGRFWVHSGLYELIGNSVYIAIFHYFVEMPSWSRSIVKIVLSPMFFLVKAGAYYYLATLLGGRGRLGRYAYLLAAISVPTAAIHLFNDLLPLVGGRIAAVLTNSTVMANQDWYNLILAPTGIISTCVTVYWLVLFYFATKVEHEMPWARAIVATVGSYLINFMLSSMPSYLVLGLIEARRILYG